jgi:hypothetical protein
MTLMTKAYKCFWRELRRCFEGACGGRKSSGDVYINTSDVECPSGFLFGQEQSLGWQEPGRVGLETAHTCADITQWPIRRIDSGLARS